jgi:serine/threonine protein kinase
LITLIGRRFGNYRALAPLGQGGMGEVYLAEHPEIGRRVAIKVLRTEFSQDPALLGRFLNEARAANAIRHPNIMEILDSGTTDDGMPYLVMELLEGETLKSRIARLGRLPLAQALDFCSQTASAVGAAHAKGIIHRDLKPDNLFVIHVQVQAQAQMQADMHPQGAEPGDVPREQVKVLDFGIAKLQTVPRADSVRTRTGTLMGTPIYMSPEQCLGTREIDSRTDIYSLGVILYEMLCGRPPFVSVGFGELVNMHLNVPPPPPRTLRPDLPPEVEGIVLRMLAKDVALRFGSMSEVRAAIKAASAGAPLPPAPPRLTPGSTVALSPPANALPHSTTFSSTGVGERLEPGRRPRRPAALLMVIAVLAMAAGLALYRWRSRPADLAAAPVAAAPPPAPAAPHPPSPIVRNVRLSISSEPDGARVLDVDGQVRGRTPLSFEVPTAPRTLELRVEKAGYLAGKVSLDCRADRVVTVELAPLPRPRHRRPSHSGTTTPPIDEPAKL